MVIWWRHGSIAEKASRLGIKYLSFRVLDLNLHHLNVLRPQLGIWISRVHVLNLFLSSWPLSLLRKSDSWSTVLRRVLLCVCRPSIWTAFKLGKFMNFHIFLFKIFFTNRDSSTDHLMYHRASQVSRCPQLKAKSRLGLEAWAQSFWLHKHPPLFTSIQAQHFTCVGQ